MKLTINNNGKISYVFVYDTEIEFDYAHPQCVEFNNEGIRFNNYSQQITITKNTFSIITPFLCTVSVERDDNSFEYDCRANLNAIYNLTFYEICDFRLDNAEICINDDVIMTIRIPSSALVTLELDDGTVKNIYFEKRFYVEYNEITIVK